MWTPLKCVCVRVFFFFCCEREREGKDTSKVSLYNYGTDYGPKLSGSK